MFERYFIVYKVLLEVLVTTTIPKPMTILLYATAAYIHNTFISIEMGENLFRNKIQHTHNNI